MVAGNADREGVEPRKVRDWDGPMVFKGPAGDSALCGMASARNRPGVLGRVEPHRETMWQPGSSGSRRWKERCTLGQVSEARKRGEAVGSRRHLYNFPFDPNERF